MTYEEYEREMNINEKLLDTLDLGKYIVNGVNVDDVIKDIENEYNKSTILPKELEGNVFNFMTVYDVANYLADRFNLRKVEEVTYYLYNT